MKIRQLVHQLCSDEEGQALPLILASMMLFVVMGVVVIDFGQMFGERREAQRAADLAALAAAQDLPWDLADPLIANRLAAAYGSAQAYLAANGYVTTDADVTSSITTNYGGDPRRVEVVVNRPSDWRFASIFGIDDPTIGARAVAELHTQPADYGIIALDSTSCEAFRVDGNVTLEVIDAGIMVNSGCPLDAVDIAGNVLVASDQFDLYFEGGASITSNSDVEPEPWPTGWRVDDPLAGLVEPDLGTLTTSPDSGGTAASPSLRQVQGGGAITLRPGIYWGGLAISGSKNVTFEPGLYVMARGGFSNGGTGRIRGDGVTIFNTTHLGSCGAIMLQGGRPLEFTPPTSGPYEGITFWQSESCTTPLLHSGTVDALSGIIYLPNAHYELAGDGTMSGVQIIASTVEIRGNGTVTIDFENGVTADVWMVSLLE